MIWVEINSRGLRHTVKGRVRFPHRKHLLYYVNTEPEVWTRDFGITFKDQVTHRPTYLTSRGRVAVARRSFETCETISLQTASTLPRHLRSGLVVSSQADRQESSVLSDTRGISRTSVRAGRPTWC